MVSIPGLAQWVKGSSIAMSCGVGCRYGLDLVLLWLWCRPAAIAPIGPLAWEPPYAAGVAQEMAKRQKKKKKVCTLYHQHHMGVGTCFSIFSDFNFNDSEGERWYYYFVLHLVSY